MNVFDLIVFVLLILFVLRGAMKGMVSQVVSVGSYLVCWIFASRFAFIIAPSIPAVEPWNQVGAIAVLFIIALIGIRFLHGIVEKWIKNRSLAHRTNMLLGGGLGFVKAMLLCMVVTFFGVMLTEATRTVIFNSKSGLRISKLIVKTGAFIPKGSCQLLEEQLANFTAKVDGTPLDPNNESESTAKMLQDGLNELRQTVSQYEQKNPSDESNTALKSAFADIFNRGDALLEKSKQLEGTNTPLPAASLLDGIFKWWSGKSAEPEPETDAGSGKLTAQAIQNEVNALIQEGKKTVQENINKQVSETLTGINTGINTDIKPVIPDNIKPADLLPNTAKVTERVKNTGDILTPATNPIQQNNREPIAADNMPPDITALPFLKELQKYPSEQNTVSQNTVSQIPHKAELFILQNNRQGRLKTSDILNSKTAVSGSVSSSQPAVLFQR